MQSEKNVKKCEKMHYKVKYRSIGQWRSVGGGRGSVVKRRGGGEVRCEAKGGGPLWRGGGGPLSFVEAIGDK